MDSKLVKILTNYVEDLRHQLREKDEQIRELNLSLKDMARSVEKMSGLFQQFSGMNNSEITDYSLDQTKKQNDGQSGPHVRYE